jgi:TIR domain
MADIFISYTRADEAWAEWIGWALEAAGLTTLLQKWDFRPGSNFVLEMQRAAAESQRTLAVLSPDYLRSAFAAPEWAAALARDPRGTAGSLIPVRVRECDAKGLLGQVVYIDLFGLDQDQAREALLAGVRPGRAKPADPPAFPGRPSQPKPFPAASAARLPVPRIRQPATDLDKRRFFREAFGVIAETFRSGLDEMKRENNGVETDFEAEAAEFRAEIYVQGRRRANCKVWIGGLHTDQGISYAEGSTARMGSAINETLSLADGGDLALSAIMNMGVGRQGPDADPSHMSPQDAGRYLWSRFVWGLS